MKTTILLLTFIITSVFSMPAMPKSFTKNELRNYNLKLISKMIESVSPELDKKKRANIAVSLYGASRKYEIDPKVMIAIIDTESDFKQEAVSSTGDVSLAQINTEIWNKEFTRMGLDKINKKLLKKDAAYALEKMGKILNILKTRHVKKDNKWYARYHSTTTKYKNMYDAKVQVKMRKIASVTTI